MSICLEAKQTNKQTELLVLLGGILTPRIDLNLSPTNIRDNMQIMKIHVYLLNLPKLCKLLCSFFKISIEFLLVQHAQKLPIWKLRTAKVSLLNYIATNFSYEVIPSNISLSPETAFQFTLISASSFVAVYNSL